MNKNERDSELVRLTAEGWSIGRLAERFGVSRQAISAKQKRLGATRSTRVSGHRAARMLGVGREWLRSAVQQLGIGQHDGRYGVVLTEADVERVACVLDAARSVLCPECGARIQKWHVVYCSSACRSRSDYRKRLAGQAQLGERSRAALEAVAKVGATIHQLTISEAEELTGLSRSRIDYLRQVGVLSVAENMSRIWRGKPCRLYSAEELHAVVASGYGSEGK
jgi:transposase